MKSMWDEGVDGDGVVEFGDGGFVDFDDGEADSQGGCMILVMVMRKDS